MEKLMLFQQNRLRKKANANLG